MRLLQVTYLLSVLFLSVTPISFWLKGLLIVFIVGCYCYHKKNKSPCAQVQTLCLSQKECTLYLQDGRVQQYQKLDILIQNELFVLLQLSRDGRKKKMVLFKDQLPFEQLKLLHVKAAVYL